MERTHMKRVATTDTEVDANQYSTAYLKSSTMLLGLENPDTVQVST